MNSQNKNDRLAGLAREADFIASAGSSVSSPKETRIRQAHQQGMSLEVMAVRFNIPPADLVKLLDIRVRTAREHDLYDAAELAYMQAKDTMANPVRSTRNRNRYDSDVCDNPLRPTRRV